MKIQLSDHFSYKKLLKFTLPSIVMMVFSSIYGVVDGFFVSNFAGEAEFKAVNFIMPVIMLLGAIGFMFGAGGSALISKTLGEGDKKKANGIFSFVTYTSIAVGIIFAILGVVFIRPVAIMLGAGAMLENCVIYGTIILCAMPFFMLQMEFQSFFVTAEKPQTGLYVTILAGVANMVLDALFIGVFRWGIAGAAFATALSQVIGGLVPIIYFLRKKNNSLLRLEKPLLDFKALLKVCTNGSSELMTNVSLSVIGILFNFQLLKYAGEEGDGVAANGVLMYVGFIFISIFIGYSIGIAPIVGYHYGAKNTDELKGLHKKSMIIILAFSIAMFLLGEGLAEPLSRLFVGYNETILEMTIRGFRLYSFSFLIVGFNIFGSAFFTALGNGLVSAILSFLRLFLFQAVTVLVMPLFMDLDGIWLSSTGSEIMAIITTFIFIFALKKKYDY